MKDHIETVIAFITGQMDGEQVPPHNSATIAQLKAALEKTCRMVN